MTYQRHVSRGRPSAATGAANRLAHAACAASTAVVVLGGQHGHRMRKSDCICAREAPGKGSVKGMRGRLGAIFEGSGRLRTFEARVKAMLGPPEVLVV